VEWRTVIIICKLKFTTVTVNATLLTLLCIVFSLRRDMFRFSYEPSSSDIHVVLMKIIMPTMDPLYSLRICTILKMGCQETPHPWRCFAPRVARVIFLNTATRAETVSVRSSEQPAAAAPARIWWRVLGRNPATVLALSAVPGQEVFNQTSSGRWSPSNRVRRRCPYHWDCQG
jgi:hypothetical protein